jgi:hypothetical protein
MPYYIISQVVKMCSWNNNGGQKVETINFSSNGPILNEVV